MSTRRSAQVQSWLWFLRFLLARSRHGSSSGPNVDVNSGAKSAIRICDGSICDVAEQVPSRLNMARADIAESFAKCVGEMDEDVSTVRPLLGSPTFIKIPSDVGERVS
jgi:hypothetical protein